MLAKSTSLSSATAGRRVRDQEARGCASFTWLRTELQPFVAGGAPALPNWGQQHASAHRWVPRCTLDAHLSLVLQAIDSMYATAWMELSVANTLTGDRQDEVACIDCNLFWKHLSRVSLDVAGITRRQVTALARGGGGVMDKPVTLPGNEKG